MEAFLAPLNGRQAGSALQEAQELMYRAWETRGRQARLALAKRALKTSPLCADAYLLLAGESARSAEEAKAGALEWLRQVAAELPPSSRRGSQTIH
jgi:hypothetical protein